MKKETIEKRLDKIAGLLAGTKETLTLDEVAGYTGLSKSYVYKLTSAGLIPHYKPNGKMLYFNRLEIDAWLQQNRVSTAAELGTKASNFLNLKTTKMTNYKLRTDLFSIRATAKILNLDFGRTTLFKFLRAKKILDQHNAPLDVYVEKGYFLAKTHKGLDRNRRSPFPLVTIKGLDFIKSLLSEYDLSQPHKKYTTDV